MGRVPNYKPTVHVLHKVAYQDTSAQDSVNPHGKGELVGLMLHLLPSVLVALMAAAFRKMSH